MAEKLTLSQKLANKRKRNFINAFRESGNITLSCQISGMSRQSVKYHRDVDEDFSREYDEALEEASDLLEKEAHRRGVRGIDKPVTYQGKIMYERYPEDWPDKEKAGKYRTDFLGEPIPVVIREYSDRMLELLLKANLPDKYRENIEVGHKVSGGVLAIPLGTDKKAPDGKELTYEQELEQHQAKYRNKPIIDLQPTKKEFTEDPVKSA